MRSHGQTVQNHSSGTQVLPEDGPAYSAPLMVRTASRSFPPEESAKTLEEELYEMRKGDADDILAGTVGNCVLRGVLFEGSLLIFKINLCLSLNSCDCNLNARINSFRIVGNRFSMFLHGFHVCLDGFFSPCMSFLNRLSKRNTSGESRYEHRVPPFGLRSQNNAECVRHHLLLYHRSYAAGMPTVQCNIRDHG